MQIAQHQLSGLTVTSHRFTVPLDHDKPRGPTIQVFARELGRRDTRTANFSRRHAPSEERPWLVFLQGGPGHESPRPLDDSGWLGRALESHRVLLLDQRGTGNSTPVSFQLLEEFTTPQQQATYLACFRADAIVKDAELIRHELGGKPWDILGQSFGGFCATHYLSTAPEGLRAAYITGGLPSLQAHADEVYRHTYPRVLQRNERYYTRYPEDEETVRQIANILDDTDVRLPNGDRLTTRRLQQIGLLLGFHNGVEQLHYLVEAPFVHGRAGVTLSERFLHGVQNGLSIDTNPLFSVLHEACYAQGTATAWAAERVRAEFPEFHAPSAMRVNFTGEMIYPWMFDEYRGLRPFAAAAEILAARSDWPQLYGPVQLRQNAVPVAAAVYTEDMYVERKFSLETAEQIANTRVWLTDEYDHDGLRADGRAVLGHLFGLLEDVVPE